MPDSDAETAPLLALKTTESGDRVRRYFGRTICLEYAYLPLLVCCFITGLIDAGSYNAWSVFMGMQTGRKCIIQYTGLGITDYRLQAIPFSLPSAQPTSPQTQTA